MEKMDNNAIAPQILPNIPETILEVRYENQERIQPGCECLPLEARDQPQVRWDANPEKFYTLLMIDPDVLCRSCPVLGAVKHWLVVNIKGSDLSTGDTIVEYGGPGPLRFTGFHRYVFLLFEYGQKIVFNEARADKGSLRNRIRFSVRGFMVKYGFQEALAWNYFRAKWAPPNTAQDRTCTIL